MKVILMVTFGRAVALGGLVLAVVWFGPWAVIPSLMILFGIGCSVEIDTKRYMTIAARRKPRDTQAV